MASEPIRPLTNPTVTITDPAYGDERKPITLLALELSVNPLCSHKLAPFKANYTDIADPATIRGTVYRIIGGALTVIGTNPIVFSADGPGKVTGEWTFDLGNVPFNEPYNLRVFVGATEDTTSFTVVAP